MSKQQIIPNSVQLSRSSSSLQLKEPKPSLSGRSKQTTDNSPLQNKPYVLTAEKKRIISKLNNNHESSQYEELDSQRALVKNEYENTFQYLSSLHKSPNDFDDPQNSQRQLVYRNGSESIDGSIEQQVQRKILKQNGDLTENPKNNIFLNIGQKLFTNKDDKKIGQEIQIYDEQNSNQQTENILSESDRVLQVNNQQENTNIFKVQVNQSESPEQNFSRGQINENQQPIILQQEISYKMNKNNLDNKQKLTLQRDQSKQIHSKDFKLQLRAESGSRLATQSMKIQELQQLNYERQRSGTQKKAQKPQNVLNADEILKK